MKKSLLRFTVASSILCLLPVAVQAQQRQPGQALEQQQQDQAAPQSDPALQRGQPPQGGANQQPGQPQRRRAQAQDQTLRLETFLANKLVLANRAEVELSQMAHEMVQNEDIKEFAEKVAQDHQELNQELIQLSPEDADGRRPDRGQPDQAGQEGADRTQPGEARRPRRGGDAPDRNRGGQPAMRGQGSLPQQLMRIAEQASEFKLLRIKEMLAEKEEGKELDMAYLDIQIIEHTGMLAELGAMKQAGSPQFKRLVSKAEESTREHLEEAKELAKKLKDQGQSPQE